MKKEINFIWESEKKIKISQAGQKNSLFYEAYQQALAGVTEIVRASTVYLGGNDPFCQSKITERDSELTTNGDTYFYNYPNNMIVFSGERGAGKSSAMLTFVNGLKDHSSNLYCEGFIKGMTTGELPGVELKVVSGMLEKCRFISLPPIDPTTLENGGQILIVILARMYQLASDAWNKQEIGSQTEWTTQDRINKKNELMRQFSRCYEHVSAIKNWEKKSSEYEGLDILSELGDSSRLKSELAELVNNLLEFCGHKRAEDPYLVIQIDDTDMNIQQAYGILEDIRKYLVIPQVIIVMAADLNHLVQVVESSVLKSYEDKNEQAREHARNIARQYMTKLFPQTRQINLPNLGTYFKEHADNIIVRYNSPNEPVLPDNSEKCQDVQEQIFRLIYRKTGLVFLKYKNFLHYIIPGNMRHLAHFLAMLVQMEEVENPDSEDVRFFLAEGTITQEEIDKHKKALRTRLQNIQRFRDYFLTTWITSNLDDRSAKKINELVEIDISKKVRYACMHLPNINGTSQKTERKANYSYVDMIRLCRECEKKSTDEMDSRFIFAIQTYFSLLAHSVVLEELIDFHDTDGNDPTQDFKLAFTRLYPLFGSRLFSYSLEADEDELTECFASVKTIGEDNKKRCIRTRWESEIKNDMLSGPVSISVFRLLCSMLADYEGDRSKITLDLCTPITNCLYIGAYDKATPLVKVAGNEKESTAVIVEDKVWRDVRNSALLTVLNWDVQQQIGNELSHIAVLDGESDGQTGEAWATSLAGFYMKIVSPFKDSTSDTKNKKDLAIAALKKLQFSGWFEPIFCAGIAINTDWYAVVATLIKDLAKIAEVTEEQKEVIADEDSVKTEESVSEEKNTNKDDATDEKTDEDTREKESGNNSSNKEPENGEDGKLNQI